MRKFLYLMAIEDTILLVNKNMNHKKVFYVIELFVSIVFLASYGFLNEIMESCRVTDLVDCFRFRSTCASFDISVLKT